MPTTDVPTIEADSRDARAKLLSIEHWVRGELMPAIMWRGSNPNSNMVEQLAQAELAVRDLEAARMRLGKVIQYNGIGVSCFDK